MNPLKKYNQYIKGELSDAETNTLTKEIISDYFADEERKEKWNKLLEKDKELLELKKKGNLPKKKIKRLLSKMLGIAASILVLLVVWWSYHSSIKAITPSDLITQHLKKAPGSYNTRKGSEIKLEAVEYYQAKEYKKAVKAYEKKLSQNAIILSEEDYFYMGFSYMKLERWDSAIDAFKQVVEHPRQGMKEDANWYLSLAFFLKGEREDAIKILEQIKVRKGAMHEDAKELLNAIKDN